MKEVGLYEAKTKLSALVQEIETNGEPIALTRHGRIVAELRSPVTRHLRKRGIMKTEGFYMAPDFNEPETGFEEFFAEFPPLSKVAEEPAKYRQD